MKSQKINNRAPRPFKTKADRWSGGGHGSQGFIPGGKPAVRPVKTAGKSSAEAERPKPEDKASEA